MIPLAALLIQAAAPESVDEAGSKAVVQIFRDACTRGEVRVPADRAHLLSDDDAATYSGFFGIRQTKRITVIKFDDPRSTYVIFADYKNNQPKSIGRRCIVVSPILTLDDALRAMVWTAPDLEPQRQWVPNMYKDIWTIDAPKRGFKSTVSVLSDRSVRIEIGTYASALNQNSSEARKQ